MAALVCDICGGKLVGKPGGIFECDSCGMEYSTEWAKEKIQEIKGTVKVEGTVEVKGTVTIDNTTSSENMLARAEMMLKDGKYTDARELYSEVLKNNTQSATAHLGLYFATKHVCDFGQLEFDRHNPENSNYKHAKEFADEALATRIKLFEERVENEHINYQKELDVRKTNLEKEKQEQQRIIKEYKEHPIRIEYDENVALINSKMLERKTCSIFESQKKKQIDDEITQLKEKQLEIEDSWNKVKALFIPSIKYSYRPHFISNNLKIGDVVKFGSMGRYHIDIEWTVLHVTATKALLMKKESFYADAAIRGQFNSAGYSTWKDSELRKVLNGSYYERMFSAEQKEWIVNSLVKNSSAYTAEESYSTEDKIFLLGYDELNAYRTGINSDCQLRTTNSKKRKFICYSGRDARIWESSQFDLNMDYCPCIWVYL